ncbi:MAG: translation initiation factor IF-2 [Endomicrobium sp.]|jgi:translation initiation factor IF-2|nr:translation initiation factor IF-2 [Endomicrobium sp.]
MNNTSKKIQNVAIKKNNKNSINRSNMLKKNKHIDQCTIKKNKNLNTLRPPIVSIMGHVDHGKTSLLDAIRNSNVVSSEYGEITQHIKAYKVEVMKGSSITFLDTPGHEIFVTMRSRGIKITDIILLVISATEGLKAQTIEIINQAKSENVPIIIAINKIDLPNADPQKIMHDLSKYGLIYESWGGDTIIINISAKNKININLLLEMIILKADMMELKANYDTQATGIVLEAQLDKHVGPVATLLIQDGTLKLSDNLVIGQTYAKVRAILNEHNQKLQIALPSTPIKIYGINEVPQVGDKFSIVADEVEAKKIVDNKKEEIIMYHHGIDTQKISTSILEKSVKELKIIIKTDVKGTLEALIGDLKAINKMPGINLKIISKSVGLITKSDIDLASVSNALIIAFNIHLDKLILKLAKLKKVDIKLYKLLPEVALNIKTLMTNMLDPIIETRVLGRASVKKIFKLSNSKIIYGCYVINGKIRNNSKIKLLRNNKLVCESNISSLKRFKEDIHEVEVGYECGISINNNIKDIQINDIIENFVIETIKN